MLFAGAVNVNRRPSDAKSSDVIGPPRSSSPSAAQSRVPSRQERTRGLSTADKNGNQTIGTGNEESFSRPNGTGENNTSNACARLFDERLNGLPLRDLINLGKMINLAIQQYSSSVCQESDSSYHSAPGGGAYASSPERDSPRLERQPGSFDQATGTCRQGIRQSPSDACEMSPDDRHRPSRQSETDLKEPGELHDTSYSNRIQHCCKLNM